MRSVEDYASDLNRALIDAAADPVFKKFMEPDDFELVTLDMGDGTQAQVQALSRASIQRVIERILERARKAGADMKDWICSPEKFNLCAKLNLPLGELMRQLHDFLDSQWVQSGLFIATVFGAPVGGHFLQILTGVGLGYGALARLCACEPPPKILRAAELSGA